MLDDFLGAGVVLGRFAGTPAFHQCGGVNERLGVGHHRCAKDAPRFIAVGQTEHAVRNHHPSVAGMAGVVPRLVNTGSSAPGASHAFFVRWDAAARRISGFGLQPP